MGTRPSTRRLAGTRGHRAAFFGGVAASAGCLFFVRAFPGWFDGGLSALVLFAATGALALVMVLLIRLATEPGDLVGTVACVAAGALLTDGALMAFGAGLYDTAETALHQAGAWRLFGTGTALGAAILLERRAVVR